MVESGIGALGKEAAEAVFADIERRHPIGRMGEPREIADAAVFLGSEEASFVGIWEEGTGEVWRAELFLTAFCLFYVSSLLQ